jgi:hypothetical protein
MITHHFKPLALTRFELIAFSGLFLAGFTAGLVIGWFAWPLWVHWKVTCGV